MKAANGVLKQAPGARKAKPPGICSSKDASKVWRCEPCQSYITNTSDCITQHLRGSRHVEHALAWGDKPYAQFICVLCNDCMENEPSLLRMHFHSKHSNASSVTAMLPVKIWRCESCSLNIPADADSVHAHNQSHAHQRQIAYDGNVSRLDGSDLAKATRKQNESEQESKIWITVLKKDGTQKRKQVNAAKKSGNAGDKNNNNFMICVFMLWPCNCFYAGEAATAASTGKSKTKGKGGKNDLCWHKNVHVIP
jgi:hypothetical protein